MNLWSQRWLNPRRNLVMCLIPLLLKQLYVLLGESLINCSIPFSKVLWLFELRTDISRLFHSIITDGKKEFLKKLCLKWNCWMILWCTSWFVEVLSCRYNLHISCRRCTVCETNPFVGEIRYLIPNKVFHTKYVLLDQLLPTKHRVK